MSFYFEKKKKERPFYLKWLKRGAFVGESTPAATPARGEVRKRGLLTKKRGDVFGDYFFLLIGFHLILPFFGVNIISQIFTLNTTLFRFRNN